MTLRISHGFPGSSKQAVRLDAMPTSHVDTGPGPIIRPQHLEKGMRPKYKPATRYHRICTAQRSNGPDGSIGVRSRQEVEEEATQVRTFGTFQTMKFGYQIGLDTEGGDRGLGGRDNAGKRVKIKNKKGAGIAFTEKGEKTKRFIKGEIRVGAGVRKDAGRGGYVRGSKRRKSGGKLESTKNPSGVVEGARDRDR